MFFNKYSKAIGSDLGWASSIIRNLIRAKAVLHFFVTTLYDWKQIIVFDWITAKQHSKEIIVSKPKDAIIRIEKKKIQNFLFLSEKKESWIL